METKEVCIEIIAVPETKAPPAASDASLQAVQKSVQESNTTRSICSETLLTTKGRWKWGLTGITVTCFVLTLIPFMGVPELYNWPWIYTFLFMTLLFAGLAYPSLTSYLYRKEETFHDLLLDSTIPLSTRVQFRWTIQIVMCLSLAGIAVYFVHFFAFDWATTKTETGVFIGSVCGTLSFYINIQNQIYIQLFKAGTCLLRCKHKLPEPTLPV